MEPHLKFMAIRCDNELPMQVVNLNQGANRGELRKNGKEPVQAVRGVELRRKEGPRQKKTFVPSEMFVRLRNR